MRRPRPPTRALTYFQCQVKCSMVADGETHAIRMGFDRGERLIHISCECENWTIEQLSVHDSLLEDKRGFTCRDAIAHVVDQLSQGKDSSQRFPPVLDILPEWARGPAQKSMSLARSARYNRQDHKAATSRTPKLDRERVVGEALSRTFRNACKMGGSVRVVVGNNKLYLVTSNGHELAERRTGGLWSFHDWGQTVEQWIAKSIDANNTCRICDKPVQRRSVHVRGKKHTTRFWTEVDSGLAALNDRLEIKNVG